MCSISWTQDNEGWVIYFNRDEQRQRALAQPPAVRSNAAGQHRMLAPLDPQSGGSWLSANDAGLFCALLNTYAEGSEASPLQSPTKSRGQVVADLAECGDLSDLEGALAESIGDAVVAPFALFGFQASADHPAMYWWDGHTLSQQALPELPFYTTSSVRTEEILAYRRRLFQTNVVDSLRPDQDELLRLHQHYDAADPARSLCMSRPDARTVSLTLTSLQPDRCRMQYRDVAGDPTKFSPPVSAHLDFDPASTASLCHPGSGQN